MSTKVSVGRVSEWGVFARDEGARLYLYADAQYGRGAHPTDAEVEALERRVHAKYPKAELVSIRRKFVPRIGGGEPVRVWWTLCWIVFEG